jgi:phosphorylase kinase alpha/beta subunit
MFLIKGLSGRPKRPIGTLSTCKIYRYEGRLYAFYPHFMDREEFYLVSDNDYLVTLFEQELKFVSNHWGSNGRPTMVIMLTQRMFDKPVSILKKESIKWDFRSSSGHRHLLNYMISLNTGICNGVRVRVGLLSELINTACIESLDFLKTSSNEDWGSLLKGNPPPLKMQKTLSVTSSRRMSLRIVTPTQNTATSMHKFDLLEQVASPHEISGEEVSFTLGDHNTVEQSIALLEHSENLYDRTNLLHYLHSTVGPKYYISKMGTVGDLLDHVYHQSLEMKEWSVARRTAGLLKRAVNSLTANVSDILIRQKPLTFGARPHEIVLDNPKNPKELNDIIYGIAMADVREAALVQELIIGLGSLIRSMPGLFTGIMRIRTHYLILALRKFIQNKLKCADTIAFEQLMMVDFVNTVEPF